MSAAVPVAARLLAERTGLQLGGGLRERLATCLDGAARASGQTPERYVARLDGDPDAFQRLLDCVTVQETAFFRHHDQFAALEREVLPGLRPPVVVWSAGCANGQEAYSLAMVLAGSGQADWRVLATDISAGAVARARTGRYSTAKLEGLPPAHRRWLRRSGELWEVDPELRRRVRFEQANLTGRFPAPPGRCQVVLCRNVLFYLARSQTVAFLDRLAAWLAPDGMVFLGYSESILAPTDRLRVERVGDAYALRVARPPEGTAAAPPQPPASAATLAASGEAAAARGDLDAAVVAFRRATSLDPDQPTTQFQLGLALEAGRDGRGARRAFTAALAALERCDPGVVAARLGGWPPSELARVLRAKLGRPAAGRAQP